MRKPIEGALLTATEVGMLVYWVFASLVVLKVFNVPASFMYSNYDNPVIVSWNWSFFPLDIIFAICGLIGRFAPLQARVKEILSTISLSLMFCAGLMAISFWIIEQFYDPFWWGVNLWLILLSIAVLFNRLKSSDV
jgi:Na+/glutamate symporter